MNQLTQDPRRDILPEQIVEDDDGNMHVLPEDALIQDSRRRLDPMRETAVGVENMDNDMPCADLMDE